MNLIIKICGMVDTENIISIAELKPDLIGFIFYPKSSRYAGDKLDPETVTRYLSDVKKTGVFVNATGEEIISAVVKYSLDIVQLHGNETPDECRWLKERGNRVIKTFHIKEGDDFGYCDEYISCTDYFLFDTSTSEYGGSGTKFDWKIIKEFEMGHPFFLSGGISPMDADKILEITNPSFYGIDLNSRFELRPGLKNIDALKKFISEVRLKNREL